MVLEVTVWAGLVFSEGRGGRVCSVLCSTFWWCWQSLVSLCCRRVTLLCLQTHPVSTFPFRKDISHVGLGPTLMSSF